VSQQSTVRFVVRGPIALPDLPGLCDRVCALIAAGNATSAWCDVSGLDPDAVAVDALARLRLAARRFGCAVRVQGCSEELQDLVQFMGLQEILLG
jgi:ABC-type transporter Mla MlaB component